MLTTVLFYVFALIILFSAFRMVSSTNLIHSALFMAAAFIGIAFIYILLSADYLAVVQILVYVGAVSVLFVFGVMLTRRHEMKASNLANRYRAAAALVSIALFLLVGRIIYMTRFIPSSDTVPDSTVTGIAKLLLGDYVIPFEVTGLLLLVAMIGAIMIGKGVNNSK